MQLDEAKGFGMFLRWMFRLMPTYSLGNGFFRIATSSKDVTALNDCGFSGSVIGGISCKDIPPGKKKFITETARTWLETTCS